MSYKNFLFSSIAFFSSITVFASVPKPAQYVALAFDNCTELERWEQIQAWQKAQDALNRKIRMTFFVSGINFIPTSERMNYKGPGANYAQGKSNIGFGGTIDEVKSRIARMQDLYSASNELASHAIGHFDGSQWSEGQWLEELNNYKNLFHSTLERFGYNNADKILADLVGFRAPYLGLGSGLYPALKKLGYRYDTSTDDEPTSWPRKKQDLWVFPLADLKIVPTGKKTLSMDYNFLVAQSGGEDDPSAANRAIYKKQMVDTYYDYFKKNYEGGRAPLNIGHHFFPYQKGVYFDAIKEFAEKVCGLPDVKCASYRDLADFMDGLSDETLQAYRERDFQ